jgi:Holliday junction resolvase RusA-like endonuclease
MSTLELELPMCPSINAAYRHRAMKGGGSMMYLTKEAKAFKQEVRDICEGFGITPVDGWVTLEVVVTFGRKGSDLDNRLKLLKDALEGYAYHNDKQVARLVVDRDYDKGNPRIWIRVSPSDYTE